MNFWAMFIFNIVLIIHQAIEWIWIRKYLKLSLALFEFKLAKVMDHIAFDNIKVKFEFAQIQVDQ